MKELPLSDYYVVAIYLLAVLFAGFWFAKFTKTGKDFFVGGNRIPWWAAGISLYMTTFSAWMFTGAASFVYNTGWFGFMYLVVKPVGFAIGFLLSAVKWRRARITSPVEYIETRYNHRTRILLSIVLIFGMMYWPGHHLASLAKIAAPALFPNVSFAANAMIIFFGIFVFLYTVSGGIWAVSITDVLQFLVLFSVCVVLVVVLLNAPEVGSLANVINELPEMTFYHNFREGTVYTHWYLIGLVVSGVFGNVVGDKAQRFFLVEDEKAAKKTGWIAFILFLTSPILFGLPPLIGKMLWPELSQLPFFDVSSKPDETIFIAVVMKYMPAGVVGLFIAAMIAASMSALDSVWNTVSAIVSVDLYKGHFRPNATDKEMLWVGRLTIIVLAVLAVIMALLINNSTLGIFTISNIVLGLITIPVTVPLLMGLISKHPLTWSALPSILAGIITAAVTRFDLNWSLGPQYIAVILVGLTVLLISRPLARNYVKNKRNGLAVTLLIGLVGYGCFAMVVAPTMAATYVAGNTFWVGISMVTITLINIAFLPLYAKEIQVSNQKLDTFFEKLATPIDVKNELGEDAFGKQPYKIVAFASFAMGVLILLLPFFLGWEKINVYLGISGILIAISALFFVGSRK